MLTDSILYQYAYLEKLIKECKISKDPKCPSQLIVKGKDRNYNASLKETRGKLDKLM